MSDSTASDPTRLVGTKPRRSRGFLSNWNRHPGVRSGSELTFGERAADVMRNGMGSWGFVGTFIVAMALWMMVNSIFHLGHPVSAGTAGFDPYPYILLNLVLSTVAGMQGAILLIAAKRSDQIASQLAQHDFDTDTKAAARIEEIHVRLADLATTNQQLLTENTRLLEALASKAGMDPAPLREGDSPAGP